MVALGALVDWARVAQVVAEAQPALLAAGALIVLTFPPLNAVRWWSVLRAVDIPLSYAECLRVTLACWPLGTLTPAKAGEFLKANAVRDHAPLSRGIGTALAERVIDVGVLGLYGVVFGIAVGAWVAAAVGLAALGAASVACVALGPVAALVVRRRPDSGLARKLANLLEVLPALIARPKWLFLCAGSSALNWFLSMAQLWLLLQAFGAPTSLTLLAAILPAATFAGLLPITIAGAGTRDGMLLLLAQGAVSPPALLAASTVYTLTGYFGLGVLGLPFLKHLRLAAR